MIHDPILHCATLLTVLGLATASGEVAKLVDTTLFESTEEHYRWSEGSIIPLEDEQHLLMAVTLFGAGGHDNTAARILAFHSRDGGLTWDGLEDGKVLQLAPFIAINISIQPSLMGRMRAGLS